MTTNFNTWNFKTTCTLFSPIVTISTPQEQHWPLICTVFSAENSKSTATSGYYNVWQADIFILDIFLKCGTS